MSSDPLTRVPGIWRAGMLYDLGVEGGPTFRPTEIHDAGNGLQEGGWRPALYDPTGATTGCLAAVCRELYRIPSMHSTYGNTTRRWYIVEPGGDCAEGPTEPAAWREAILAHPLLSELK